MDRSVQAIEDEIAQVSVQLAALQKKEKTVPLAEVVIDSLVVTKIVKHCKENFPDPVTGQLLGLDVDRTLEITNCFPMISDYDGTDYQIEMMRNMRDVNVDNNVTGWYQSSLLGKDLMSRSLVEGQFIYQDKIKKCVVIVYDPVLSSQGALALTAYQLSPKFLDLCRSHSFESITQQALDELRVSWSQILEKIPIRIRNSSLTSAFLWELEENLNLSEVNDDILSLSATPFLERNMESMVQDLDNLTSEQNNYLHHLRQIVRQQQQQQIFLQKRRAENAQRRMNGEPELPEEDPNFIPLKHFSRLDGLLKANQLNLYADQVNHFAALSLSKLYTYRVLSKSEL